jgi:hypothetical protein
VEKIFGMLLWEQNKTMCTHVANFLGSTLLIVARVLSTTHQCLPYVVPNGLHWEVSSAWWGVLEGETMEAATCGSPHIWASVWVGHQADFLGWCLHSAIWQSCPSPAVCNHISLKQRVLPICIS